MFQRSRTRRSTNASLRFSPYALAVALTPVVLQTSTPLSCNATTLSELAVIVDERDVISGFDPATTKYSILFPATTDEALVHSVATDPEAQVWIDVLTEGERVRYLDAKRGGSDVVVPLPPGSSTIEVRVWAQGEVSEVYEVAVETGINIDSCIELAYEQCPVSEAGGAGKPLAIDIDSDGNAWALGESHTHLQFFDKSFSCPERTLIEIPHHAAANPFHYRSQPSKTSVLGESVVFDHDDQIVWFTQGGASLRDQATNHSRVVSYEPSTETFRAYNLPGNANEVIGVHWDQQRNYVWAAEAGFYSDFVPGPEPHQGTIIAFDPDTAAYDNDWLWLSSLDGELCGPYEEPTTNRCFKRYQLPASAMHPAHLVTDANGFVWFTNYWGTSIGRLDPNTGSVIIYPLRDGIGTCGEPCVFVGAGPWEIEISPDGQYVVWSEYFDATIARMPIARALDVECRSLAPGGGNPCVEEMLVPLNLHYQQIHSFAYDSHGNIWFGTDLSWPNPPAGAVQSTLGLIASDWSGVRLLDPADFAQNDESSQDKQFAGFAIDPVSGKMWVNEFNPTAIGRFAPLPCDNYASAK